MSAREMAGRPLMVGLPGPELDRGTADRLRRLAPGGVILFARNLRSPEQTRRLLSDCRNVVDHPLLCAIDQEGGKVSRLAPWAGETPTADTLARMGATATRRFAEATARCLRALGFNLDFAPVVDLCTAEATNGIGDRSFGTDPVATSHLAGAFLDGLQEQGVAGCLKHFPGLGPTSVDSHERLPTADRDGAALRELDLVPYARLGARAASVMVGHGYYPALERRPEVPATLSSSIVTELLRGELGFRGLVVSDDLEMGAVAPLDEEGEAAVRSIDAGCDLVLYCAKLERAEKAADALVTAARSDGKFSERLRRASSAVTDAAERWQSAAAPSPPWEAALRDLRGFDGTA